MRYTVSQFEDLIKDKIKEKIKGIRKPFPAAKIAAINSEDKFVLYYASDAFDVLMTEFIALDDQKKVSDELYRYFNLMPDVKGKIPVICKTLKELYQEYRKSA